MDSADIAIIIGAVSGLIASLIYGFKNVRESSCSISGCECVQEVKDDEVEKQEPSVTQI